MIELDRQSAATEAGFRHGAASASMGRDLGRALDGRVAIVTGASSGIGAATARTLALAGAQVAMVARRRDRLEALAGEIRSDGGSAAVFEADMSTEVGIEKSINGAHSCLGRLDILVNNAGLVDVAPVERADVETWRRLLDLNVFALMLACRAAIPHMRQAGGGDIVNISSTSGLYTAPGLAAYSASKFAVEGFTEGLRREVSKPDNIRVTAIEPGPVATELIGHISDPVSRQGIHDWFDRIEPLQAEDVAEAILFAVTRPRHVSVNALLIRPTDSDTEL